MAPLSVALGDGVLCPTGDTARESADLGCASAVGPFGLGVPAHVAGYAVSKTMAVPCRGCVALCRRLCEPGALACPQMPDQRVLTVRIFQYQRAGSH